MNWTMPEAIVSTSEAFALFDKNGDGKIEKDQIGDLLRVCGKNPSMAEVAEITDKMSGPVDLETFKSILNRPQGFAPMPSLSEFIKGFQVFDKENTGKIGFGELKYLLTDLGEPLSEAELKDVLETVPVQDGKVDYKEFIKTIMAG